MEQLSQASVDEIEIVIRSVVEQGLGAEAARKPIKDIAGKHGWDWLTGRNNVHFTPRLVALVSAISYATRCAEHRQQLSEEEHAVWIFHAGEQCGEAAQQLDCLCRAPDSSFWQSYFPPHGWTCDCHVSGARSPAMVVRLGGDLDKPVPAWCDTLGPDSFAAAGFDPLWANGTPSVRQLLEAIAAEGFTPPW